ncbi:hypothetical protein IQ07DRAFT_633969 [Pyrenochaeta sp. DS3sAY3a]|nr:hypothetical protein IQ07DRAFT_633969 [Pyrenochaeta sp. DS3sAY3a]
MTTPAEPQAADEARKLAPATAESDTPIADGTSSADAGEEKWDVKDTKARRDRDIPEDGKGKWSQQGPQDRDRDRNGRNGNYRGRGNQRGRGNYRGNGNQRSRKNPNEEYRNLPTTSDKTKIWRQIRFYFSIRNLCYDWHLFNLLGGPDNIPVPLKHIADFNRMKQFQPYSAIVDAVREMDDFILVEDGDRAGLGNEAIKLKVPIVAPAPNPNADHPRTLEGIFFRMKADLTNDPSASVYIKGFDVGDSEPGQIELEEMFRPFGSVSVRKRRDDDKNFKGSIFIDFDSVDAQKDFLNLDPKPQWNGKDLTIMGKREYVVAKCEEKGIKPDWDLTEQEKEDIRKERRREKDRANPERMHRSYGGRGRGTPFGRRGNRNGFGLDRDRRDRDRRDRDRASPEQEQSRKAEEDVYDSDKEHAQRFSRGETSKRKADDENDNSPKKPKMTIKVD